MANRKKKWDEKYKQNSISKTLLELLFYIMFLINVSLIAYNTVGPSYFYFSNMMLNVFIERNFKSTYEMDINFNDIITSDDFWKFSNAILPLAVHDNAVIRENKLLGLLRFRQLRVRNDSCVIPHIFQNQFKECFGEYSPENEDRSDLVKDGSIWNYKVPMTMRDEWFLWGILNMYPGGGFIQEIRDPSGIIDLSKRNWIDRGTRVVFVEFSMYNANSNIFCIIKLIAEVPPTGGIVPSYLIRTVKLLDFTSKWDYLIVVCQFILTTQIIYYTIEELVELARYGCVYFLSFWNWIDMSIIAISVVTLTFSWLKDYLIIPKLGKIYAIYQLTGEIGSMSFEFLSFLQTVYNEMMGILVFISWIKVLKYISFNQTMMQFSTTLKRCAKDLFGFGVMFIIVFVAFAHFGFMIFGTENSDFKSFKASLFTAMRIILGDFDYLALERTNRILGPIYFILYIFFVFFILLNMFLAIINDTYSAVKSEKFSSTSLSSWFNEKFGYLFKCFRRDKQKNYPVSETEPFQEVKNMEDDRDSKHNDVSFIIKNYDTELKKIESKIYIVEKSMEQVLKRMDRLISQIELARRK